MPNTLNKMPLHELISYYEIMLNKLNEYSPESQDYYILNEKLTNIESIIIDKRPNYFKEKERESVDMNISEDNYSIEQTASILNVTRQTVFNWIKQKKVNSIKIGSKIYIKKDELDRVMTHGTC